MDLHHFQNKRSICNFLLLPFSIQIKINDDNELYATLFSV